MKKDKHSKKETEETLNEQELNDQNKPENEETANLAENLDLQLKESQDKYLRLLADFENFRRRTMQERRELIQQGNKELLSSILPVLDDMERGLSTMDNSQDKDAIIEGIKLIFNKFKNILQQAGVVEIPSKGEEFDPEYHDAVVSIPAPSPELKGKVVEEIQRGYKLNDKILRHSKVVVGE